MAARRTVRAILIDDTERLVLLRRVRPGQPPYWVTPGGGIEPTDPDAESALRRELLEEFGATIEIRSCVVIPDAQSGAGDMDAAFFLARLISIDPLQRTGDEFRDASRGTYDVERLDPRGEEMREIDLRPDGLRRFIIVNAAVLVSGAAG